MSSVHSNVHAFMHISFHVHRYGNLIPKNLHDEVLAYISEIVQYKRRRHRLIAIGGVSNHVHLLVEMHPGQSIADLVRDIKSYSCRFIREHPQGAPQFQWQTGYLAKSVCKRCSPHVAGYVRNQKVHHKKR